MPDTTFAPGTVITNRFRLWRVDAHEADVLVATSMDGGQTEQQKLCLLRGHPPWPPGSLLA